ncbi:putative dibenzothiophene desulfurization enzyme A [Thozetella sp. PMI_491]|nr:putative dibenzothiophene desulfurization enzyme A [Thozetella sp. PMI_491]
MNFTEPSPKQRRTNADYSNAGIGAASSSPKRRKTNGDHRNGSGGAAESKPEHKRRIFLNAFDMFTVGQMSFGQWRNPKDKSATKRRDLSYWTELAKLLERGDFNALFLADTFGWCDVYKGNAEACVRTGTQFPMGDPAVPVTAMAAVTKNLGFAITTSTSFEAPYTLAKRFSTLDHLTGGRFEWNIVTSWKASGFKAVSEILNGHRGRVMTHYRQVGIDPIPHDKRYEIGGELWEGSWADDALVEDREKEIYADYNKIRVIHHKGEHFHAGTSTAGIEFDARHAEGIFVVGLTPHMIAPRVKAIRDKVREVGRDPYSVKVFASITPIIGGTKEEAQAKYEEALQYASEEGGLALLKNLAYKGDDVPVWTPRSIGKAVPLGASGPVPVGTAEEVADEMERWMEVADINGFNVGHITVPGTWEDAVDLLVPELRRRGQYAPKGESGTMRERVYGLGCSRLSDEHPGSRYKYDAYEEECEDQ